MQVALGVRVALALAIVVASGEIDEEGRQPSPPERRLICRQGSLLRRLQLWRHCGEAGALLLLKAQLLLPAHLLLAVGLLLGKPMRLPALKVGRLLLLWRGVVGGRRSPSRGTGRSMSRTPRAKWAAAATASMWACTRAPAPPPVLPWAWRSVAVAGQTAKHGRSPLPPTRRLTGQAHPNGHPPRAGFASRACSRASWRAGWYATSASSSFGKISRGGRRTSWSMWTPRWRSSSCSGANQRSS